MKPKVMLNFPFISQTFDYDCGPSCIQGILAYYGKDESEGIIIKKCNTTVEYGTKVVDMKHALTEYGLTFKDGNMTVEDIKSAIDNNQPVILLLQAWAEKEVNWKEHWNDGHYVIAIGYDDNYIYFEDPSCMNRVYLTTNELLERWHGGINNEKKYFNFGIIVEGNPKYNLEKLVHMN